MATTHNITTTFSGKAAEGYLKAALLSGKTLASGAVDIRDNVQHKEVVQLLSSDANLVKPATCDFDPTGTLTTTEVVLQPTEFQVNLEVCAKNYRSSWESLQMRGIRSGIPNSLGEFILEHVVAKTADAIEKAIWTNSTSSTDLPFDGWETLAGANSDVVDVSASSVTSSNVTDEIGKVVDAIPSAVLAQEDLYIYLPTAIFMKYVRALGGFASQGQGSAGIDARGHLWYQGQQELFYDGIKVLHCPGMTSTKMIAATRSNMLVGTSLFSELNQASILDMSTLDGSQNARAILRGSIGVELGYGSEVVLYS